MTIAQFEENSIEMAYLQGIISLEEYKKLMDDITPYLWNEM